MLNVGQCNSGDTELPGLMSEEHLDVYFHLIGLALVVDEVSLGLVPCHGVSNQEVCFQCRK